MHPELDQQSEEPKPKAFEVDNRRPEHTDSPPIVPEQPHVPVSQPAIQPDLPPAVAQSAVPQKEAVNATLIILQWLTYAFWGWTVLALSVLTYTVLAFFMIGNADIGGFTPYGIAAVMVLLPISLVCDLFYSRREPAKKVGAGVWLMVLHAVLFALFGIGSLIFAVFEIVQLLTSSTDSTAIQVGLYSALIIAVYYALTFFRTLNPSKFGWVKRVYKMIMLISVGIIVLLGLVGPVAKERTLRDDKLIESNLGSVERAISSYSFANKKLPADLGVLNLKDDAKKLVDRKLVVYKPQTGVKTVNAYDGITYKELTSPLTYRYELCATYKYASNDYTYRDYPSYKIEDEYTSNVDTFDHPAGEICYKLETTGYDY